MLHVAHRHFFLFAAALICAGLTTVLIAQTPQPAGPSLQVNTVTGSANNVQVAWRCDANVTIVVWASNASAGPDTDQGSIQGRFFVGLQPIGPQFQVNQATAGDQRTPAIQILDSGDFVVAWVTVDGTDRTLHTRTYDRVTLAPGAELAVGNAMPRIDGFDIADDGRIGMAWWEGRFIFGQLFEASGLPTGAPLSVELSMIENVTGSGSITLEPTSTLLAWSSSEELSQPDDFRRRLAFQRFLTDGSLSGPEVAIFDFTCSGQDCENTSIDTRRTLVTDDGDFVVTSRSTSFPDDVQYDISARRVRPDGQVAQFVDVVSSYALPIENQTVGGETDGDFLVVWSDSTDNGVAARVAVDGAQTDPAFQLTDRTLHFSSQFHMAYNGPGSPFAVVWNDQTNVFWRRFLSFPGLLQDGFESGDTAHWCTARSGR